MVIYVHGKLTTRGERKRAYLYQQNEMLQQVLRKTLEGENNNIKLIQNG